MKVGRKLSMWQCFNARTNYTKCRKGLEFDDVLTSIQQMIAMKKFSTYLPCVAMHNQNLRHATERFSKSSPPMLCPASNTTVFHESIFLECSIQLLFIQQLHYFFQGNCTRFCCSKILCKVLATLISTLSLQPR